MIEELRAKLQNSETERKLAVSEAVQAKEKELTKRTTEITELKSQLSYKDAERDLKEQAKGRADRVLQGFQGPAVHEDDRRKPGTALPEPV